MFHVSSSVKPGPTGERVMDVAAEMEGILEQEPELGDFGFGVFYPQAKTLEERESGLRKEREYIREPRSLEQFMAARAWLTQFSRRKTINRCATSYGLKHVASRDIGYVTNGVFIAAAIAEGFIVQRLEDGPNACFNISSAAWKRVAPFPLPVC
jgi:hypothetical protein